MNTTGFIRLALALTAATLLQTSNLAAAPIELIGVGKIAGNALDGLGASPAILEDGTPHNIVGGMGSALTYTGIGDLYLATPDRGPASGADSYLDRYYLIEIAVQPGFPVAINPSLVRATLLTNEQSKNFTGLASAFDPTNSPASLRLDPEGVRVSPTGTFYSGAQGQSPGSSLVS